MIAAARWRLALPWERGDHVLEAAAHAPASSGAFANNAVLFGKWRD